MYSLFSNHRCSNSSCDITRGAKDGPCPAVVPSEGTRARAGCAPCCHAAWAASARSSVRAGVRAAGGAAAEPRLVVAAARAIVFCTPVLNNFEVLLLAVLVRPSGSGYSRNDNDDFRSW